MSDTGSSEGPFIPTGPSPEKMPPVLGTPSFTLVVGRHQTPQDMENFKEALVEARGQNKMPVAILEGIGMGDSRRIEGILNQLSQGNISVDKALGQISGAGTQGKPTQYLESVCRVLANMQCPVVICDISMEELGRIVPAEENLLNTMSPSFVADTESLEDWTNSIKQAFLTQAQGVGQREAEIMASVLRAVQRYRTHSFWTRTRGNELAFIARYGSWHSNLANLAQTSGKFSSVELRDNGDAGYETLLLRQAIAGEEINDELFQKAAMGFYLTPVLNRVFPGSLSIDLAKLQRAIIDELHGDMMGDFYDLLRSPSTTDPGEFMLTTYVSRHPMV